MADNKNSQTTVKTTPTAKPATTVKPVTPAAKPATSAAAKPAQAATPRPTAATPARPAATPARPAQASTTAAKPATAATPARPAATPTRPAQASATAAKPATAATPARPAATPTRPAQATAAEKSAPAATEQAKPAAQNRKPERSEAAANVAAIKSEPKEKAVKADKAKAKDKAKPTTTTNKSGATGFAALSPKIKLAIYIVAAVLAVAIVAVILAVSLVSCNGGNKGGDVYSSSSDEYLQGTRPSDNAFLTAGDYLGEGSFTNQYKNRTKVGYNAEYLGGVARNIPQTTSDEGLVGSGAISAYPTYGKGMNYNDDQKKAVIAESWKLVSVNTRIGSDGYTTNTFDRMDAEGNLYLNGNPTGKKLYKHTSAVGMYYGNVSDTEPAIVKRLTYEPRANGTSYNVTGVYAPAGEVIKIELSEADMQATKGIEVMIGQALYNHKANNIWAQRQINRMPVILNTMVVNAANSTYDSDRHVYTAYVGSFFGGPIYVYNEAVKFSVTISGGVRYAHYILGYTTPEDYAENLKSSAPYFDLEVRENGVLHSGPKSSVSAAVLAYDNIYKAAELWEKIALVSTQRSKQGIVFIYDPFVAAGAAVAFPGQMSVNCPTGWMSGSLNYDAFVRSGSWGNVHEYNHNFQGYGCGGGADGEVTNNAISLVEYTLFTAISSARQIGSYGGGGLSGWNCYTSATWALNRVNKGEITSTNGLAVYATLLHNLGQEAFMRAASGRDLAYFQKWGEVTHQNMSYFTKLISAYSTADYSALAQSQKDYPMFVPVSSVYQTGRSYMYDDEKRYITTMQPYKIKFGETINVDMRPYTVDDSGMYKYGSVVIPAGFTYTVKKVAAPQNGTFTKTGDSLYTYTPNANQLRSGKIVVTLGITKTDNAFNVDDVDLVLEFEQSHEMNKNVLERTIYTYTADTMPESAIAAYDSGFIGAARETVDNINPTQNGNTEVWSKEALPANTYYEIKGKFYISETAKYRIAMRGRWDCALYIAVNGDKDYKLAAKIQTTESHANFYPDDPETYYDQSYKAGDWVYFKAVLKSENKGGKNSYIGLGTGQFVPPQGTINESGQLVDGSGNIIENPKETVTVNYANAYRASYEFVNSSFTSEYFFLRDYRYTYRSPDVEYHEAEQTIVEHNFVHWSEQYKIENLFDGNPNTTAHSAQHKDGKPETYVNANSPFKISVELDKQITANAFIVYARNDSPNKTGLPQNFKLEFRDRNGGKVVATKTFTGATHANGEDLEVALGEYVTFGYYTLTVTKSENDYFVASNMGFASRRALVSGTVMEADNTMFRYDGKWAIKEGLYTFGHIYEGADNATMKFVFNGTAFAVFAYKGALYGGMEVFIDGKSAGKISLSDGGGDSQMVFLSDDLKDGKHTVEIRCNNGIANIDNIVLWK